jgi:hypothetical protein
MNFLRRVAKEEPQYGKRGWRMNRATLLFRCRSAREGDRILSGWLHETAPGKGAWLHVGELLVELRERAVGNHDEYTLATLGHQAACFEDSVFG